MSTSDELTTSKTPLTYEQAAEVLGVRVGTLYSWVSRRVIPFVRVGPRVVRFLPSDLKHWIESRRVSPLDRTK